MKCPFLIKKTERHIQERYANTQNPTGNVTVKITEEFEDCVETRCTAFRLDNVSGHYVCKKM